MLHAVETPVLKVAAVASLALALGLGLAPSESAQPAHRRLVLHAPKMPGALYITRWDMGEVLISGKSALQPITFRQRAFINDGCEWLATERLTPVSSDRYSYTYDEDILSCEPGATPALKTPRTGYVTVVPAR